MTYNVFSGTLNPSQSSTLDVRTVETVSKFEIGSWILGVRCEFWSLPLTSAFAANSNSVFALPCIRVILGRRGVDLHPSMRPGPTTFETCIIVHPISEPDQALTAENKLARIRIRADCIVLVLIKFK